ncbi:MAG: YdeI/OmpD-associated family protein [Pseudomonadota bacterium]
MSPFALACARLKRQMSEPMAVIPNKKRIKPFASQEALETWMRSHHDQEPELWIKIHKKDSGLPSVSAPLALDVMLCWGWIDGIRKGFDEKSFLQRYTPRRSKSIWSQVNRVNVARLITEGRMTPHGHAQIEAARKDGRWDAAYAPMRAASANALPQDLVAAIRKNAKATKTFKTLNRANLFSLAFRTNNMKTAPGRAKKIATLVAMLARGEAIQPQKARGKTKGSSR